MESNWDLESLLEQCCSELSTDNGDFDWLDEKVDLSAWTELDFPDELAPGMHEAEPLSTHGSLFHEPKLQSELLPSPSASQSFTWLSDPLSPTFPSPPLSPLNGSHYIVPVRSQLEELQLSFEDMHHDGLAACTSLPSTPISSPTSASTLPSPVASTPRPGSNCTSPTVFLYKPASSPLVSSPQSPVEGLGLQPFASSPVTPPEPQMPKQSISESALLPELSTGEMEVVVDDNAGVEEYTVLAGGTDDIEPELNGEAETAKVSVKACKRKRRGSRKTAKECVRKERKRLQNKDAATRYRQKKKQQTENISQEYTEHYEENCKLKAEVQRVSNEISYLKGLMRELAKAKGLLK